VERKKPSSSSEWGGCQSDALNIGHILLEIVDIDWLGGESRMGEMFPSFSYIPNNSDVAQICPARLWDIARTQIFFIELRPARKSAVFWGVRIYVRQHAVYPLQNSSTFDGIEMVRSATGRNRHHATFLVKRLK